MAVILGVVTEDCRKYWPQFFGTLLGISDGVTTQVPQAWNPLITHFKMGEGGWVDPGSGKVPRTPDPTLRRESAPLIQDLDAAVDLTRGVPRYPSDSQFVFEKVLTISDFSFDGPSTIRITCLLDFTEANDDGFSNSPEFWEIGFFSDHPLEPGEKLMVAYGTFPMEIKDGSKQLENVVRIVF